MKRLELLIILVLLSIAANAIGDGDGGARRERDEKTNLIQEERGGCQDNRVLRPRPHSVSILEFGAVGDGLTLNTLAFQNAIFYLRSFADKGGAQLYVPAGKWLTGSFNLTSHLTLFLDRDAVILGSQDSSHWPVIDPLPSYGRGLELPGGSHGSLINGQKLTDVVITGDNGTIDGQGSVWWDWFNSGSLNYSRPHLVEITSSEDVVISNLTFLNAPAWSIHPVYCSNVLIQNIAVRAAPNSHTDGIVPDSCTGVCIEDSVVSVGNDAIALKSGWDEYGISYGASTSGVHARRLFLHAPMGSALALGTEMSGGISDILFEHLSIFNSRKGLSVATTKGRGGFVRDVLVSNIEMENVEVALRFDGNCGAHPDDRFNPEAFPAISRITVKNLVGQKIGLAGNLSGIEEAPFTAICLSNVSLSTNSDRPWACSNVVGYTLVVVPEACQELETQYSNSSSVCYSLSSFNGGHAEAL
ncbi:hypothetical protein AMTRI_Chr02g263250 [Amborella trichopoda]|uniref:Pectate lyase superfamily protein domain-containing protein n=1 Tax=Amborella trichopoda TaxID=13333 RepID=W1P040_AMBTC|nr:probable polygalacturonase [Amborella trichopoda]ERN03187.1 hypothetical protein AMTR_s00003p00141260 [Amborella trichopoda]|eukprot:XP_020521271.1 probable polygalacturonase [Amborella trichopoda]